MQRRTPIVLGIDAGTTSVKTVAFRLDGTIAGVARSSVRIERDSRGGAEAELDRIWDAAAATITAVLEEVRADDDPEILAIGLTGQGDGAWFVDREGRPVRPAALWLDGRATERLATWRADGRAEAVHRATGSPLFAGALPLLAEELFEAEPGTRERFAHQLNCKDWLRYRLTGEIATDPSEASRTYLDTATGDYSAELVEALGHEHIRAGLPEVRDPQSLAGRVTAAAAAQLGLPEGTPVAVGLVDTAAAGVGLGAIGDGQGYAILGTTGFVGVNQPSRAHVRSDAGIVLSTGRGTQVLESMAPMTGTPNLDWVRGTLGLTLDHWSEVERQAAAVPAGSGGVLYLPYGSPSGERAPFLDSAASASWHGMSVTTTPAELLRSGYEGIAFSLRESLDVLGVAGALLVCGGGSESDLLCAILADVTGREIVRQDAPEVGARGVASLALVASGHAVDLASAVEVLAPDTSVFAPDAERSAVYAEAYGDFLAIRDAMRPHWPALRRLRAASTRLAG
ncbi:FGGY family carbohydrate kinase [Agromyces soli]|uniref:FGGY family carbohydrate kinase n=1 Tax=Agromyces soli TaxID=659012 RepID=A0ABY4AX36_9MICO|nr:FGGY family carbohydrate kinase [Agromyces soli]UOE26403.1 FGGY family carbohydrate kinase [Agromyces soli]